MRLAGFSSGWRDCARGGCSAERCGSRAGAVFVLLRSCGSIGMSCARSRPSYVPIGMSYARSRLLFAHSAKQNGLRYVPFLFRRGSGSPFVRSQWPCAYRTWWVHFGLARFFMAIPTENEGTRERGGRGKRSRRRGVGAFLRGHIGFAMLSAGSTLGLRAPDCAKETRLPGLSSFDSRCGCGLHGGA